MFRHSIKRMVKVLAIDLIHTFLVHPGKNSKQAREIGGTNIPLNGSAFDLLSDVYENSERERLIPLTQVALDVVFARPACPVVGTHTDGQGALTVCIPEGVS